MVPRELGRELRRNVRNVLREQHAITTAKVTHHLQLLIPPSPCKRFSVVRATGIDFEDHPAIRLQQRLCSVEDGRISRHAPIGGQQGHGRLPVAYAARERIRFVVRNVGWIGHNDTGPHTRKRGQVGTMEELDRCRRRLVAADPFGVGRGHGQRVE